MNNRVLVAMSGGVDSSLAAALLLEQGRQVEGVTMKLTAGVCCDIASAQAVSSLLGIRHRMLDLQEEFRKDVVSNFIDEYRQGRTPNPCIRCNDLIKFERLLTYARTEGFGFLATGHYARVERDAAGGFFLKKGADPAKDQSYFLYRLTREQLTHALFPLGALAKTEVRKRAKVRGLPAAERPESQEICFVPDNKYRAFLQEHAPETMRPGELVTPHGRPLGRHEGIAFFTVGQRRKLGVSAGSRLYVVRIDRDTNRVVLGTRADLETRELVVSSPRFISPGALAAPRRVEVKVRYRAPVVPATITSEGRDRVRVSFDKPVEGVTPGQAAVFYDGDAVVGGGIIEAA